MNYRAHDALQDVRVLQTLFGVLQPKAEMISRHKFTLCAMEQDQRLLAKQKLYNIAPSGSTADRQRPPQRRHRKLSPVNNFHKKN